MKLIHSGNVCVISGATGSGKTTQIPQFILDEALEKGKEGLRHLFPRSGEITLF